jgi:hypothetical protein
MNFKTSLLALSGLLLANTASHAGIDLGTPAGYTPYDRYMSPVKQVISSLRGQSPDFKRVQSLLSQGRSFRYSFTDPYTAALPEVTAHTKKGDCKAKSLWLMDQMGDSNLRYVIGKARSTSKISHAWVMWNDGSTWWILDPTNANRPIAAESTSRNEYIPQYSWSRNGSYRHSSTSNSVEAVASKAKRNPSATAEKR